METASQIAQRSDRHSRRTLILVSEEPGKEVCVEGAPAGDLAITDGAIINIRSPSSLLPGRADLPALPRRSSATGGSLVLF